MFHQPLTPSDRARSLRSENRKLKKQLSAFREWAPDPDALALLIRQSEANKHLYRAALARNVILNRKVRDLDG